jgi:hypothetical protein
MPGGGLEVFLCKKSQWPVFEQKLADFIARHQLQRVEVTVPRYAAIKKEQLPEWNAVWPVSFHRQEPCVRAARHVDLILAGARRP